MRGGPIPRGTRMAAATVGAALLFAACGAADSPPPPPGGTADTPPSSQAPPPEPAGSRSEPGAGASQGAPRTGPVPEAVQETGPLARVQVRLYFPAASADGLVAEGREIFETASPVDRAKQILSDLLLGPTSERARPGVPQGARFYQVYVLDDGTAYVDFASDLPALVGGGAEAELYAVYSVVNSLALNIPEIHRVGILIEGRPCDTLNGHLDLRRPLAPRLSLVAREQAEATPGAGAVDSVRRAASTP